MKLKESLKFQIGNRVKVSHPNAYYGKGIVVGYDYQTKNYIVQIDDDLYGEDNYERVITCCSSHYQCVKFEGVGAGFFDKGYLKLAQIRDTKIARKVHPKAKILGNGWLEC